MLVASASWNEVKAFTKRKAANWRRFWLARNTLVVEEVGTEEEEETFEVHDLGVLSTMDETRA
jgi:hypothetical protein